MSLTRAQYDDWLARLRSGDYRQGKGRLRTVDQDGPAFCCLGVLCEALEVDLDAEAPEDVGWPTVGDMSGVVCAPPELMAALSPTIRADLARVNDKDETFDAIAKLIERAADRGEIRVVP